MKLISKNVPKEFYDALGLDPAMVKRVVIDIDVNSVVMAYVEMYTDEKALNVFSSLDGVQIEVVRKTKGEQ